MSEGIRTKFRAVGSIASLSAAGFLTASVLGSWTEFGTLFGTSLLGFIGCQVAALLPWVGVLPAGQIIPSALGFIFRLLGMASCGGSAAIVALGSISWLSYHGLKGVIAPSSMSGVVDENGIFHSFMRSMTVPELIGSMLFVLCQAWGALILFRRRSGDPPNTRLERIDFTVTDIRKG